MNGHISSLNYVDWLAYFEQVVQLLLYTSCFFPSMQIIALLYLSMSTFRELTVINESDGQQDSPPGGSWTQESSCVASIRIARRRMMTILSWPKNPPANHTNVITSISTPSFFHSFPLSFASLTPTTPPKYKLRTKIHYTCSPPTPAKQCLGRSLRERKTLTPSTSTPSLNKSTNPSLPSLENCTESCGPSSFLNRRWRPRPEIRNSIAPHVKCWIWAPRVSNRRIKTLTQWCHCGSECAPPLSVAVWKQSQALCNKSNNSLCLSSLWPLQWMHAFIRWMRAWWVDEQFCTRGF